MLLTYGRFDDPNDIGRWRSSFIPLAVHRSVPLWRVANLPAAMCDRPDGLIAIAHELIAALNSAYAELRPTHTARGGPRDDAYAERGTGLLKTCFGEIAEAFGPGPAGELLLWVARNDASRETKERWWAWWLLLHGIASGRRAVPDALAASEGTIRVISQSIREPGFEEALARASAAARATPLDVLEERIVRHDTGTAEEPSSHDVVISMKLAASRERAYLAHCLLSMLLAPEHLEVLERLAAHELGRP